jgi:spermidine synthase
VPRPWTKIDSVTTPEGLLELRRRGDEWMVSIAGRVLMSSAIHRTEAAVATLGLAHVVGRPHPRVLVGGLGLGFTLRAALDALPRRAEVRVAELNPRVVDWCRGPVAEAIGHALDDPRVRVEVGDVMESVRRARDLDAIVVDLYEGPKALPSGAPDPLYGASAIASVKAALAPEGVYAVWSEEPYPPFEARLERAGFAVERVRAGRGGPRHAVYLARLGLSATRRARGSTTSSQRSRSGRRGGSAPSGGRSGR